MTDLQREGWFVFEDVVAEFSDNNKDPDYKIIIKRMLKSFKELGNFMRLKVNFLKSQVDYVPENSEALGSMDKKLDAINQVISSLAQNHQIAIRSTEEST
ncbi:unnamed protein product [Acanthoscelides obtectus]|uniref:Uncharacterized protein n=1 Tax=Acanthoscelides obtectus TaxID=200917 RepID=A0A9P0M289_ACAOB|nr:unnamed protein product [Acanthoscelides obtectus]CAK1629431.1 hypothetical protein AOBTE_LOCUS5741 [Acanthoscelides obtectus]